MRDKYGVTQDKYCYPNSDVLINLLNIRDGHLLSDAEAEFTAERYRTYQPLKLALTDFNLAHLQFLHHHLFQDIYEWAGQLRDVDISKGDTRFCTCSRIEPEAKKLLDLIPSLAEVESYESLVSNIADLFCEMNLLHPFREGNGRVQRFFFEELLFALGHDVSWPNMPQKEWADAEGSPQI